MWSSLRTVPPPATGQGRRRPAHRLRGQRSQQGPHSVQTEGRASVSRNAAGLNCKVVWFDASPGDFLTGCKGFHAAAELLGDQGRCLLRLALQGLVVQLDTPTCFSGNRSRSCFCHCPGKLVGIVTLSCLQAKVDLDQEPAYLTAVGGRPCGTRTPEGSSWVRGRSGKGGGRVASLRLPPSSSEAAFCHCILWSAGARARVTVVISEWLLHARPCALPRWTSVR